VFQGAKLREFHVSIKDKPHYTISARAMADWLESQPDKWWSVDGDPLLESIVDFPCPTDELAPAIRNEGKSLLLEDRRPASQAHGEEIGAERLDELTAFSRKKRHKILVCSWADSNVDWLLLEDEALV
jgi:hypothetical protein